MAVSFTKEQQACIESLIGPVDVSAGAGSGKTFTLTQRIACALEDPSSGVDDIDQVCAITFTEKAAAELKSRVRSTLRAKGLFDQALKVDGAWISTIHGMCARILRAQSLRLGIDPYFAVMGEGERARLLEACIDEVLQADDAEERLYTQLQREFHVTQQGYGTSLVTLVQQLMDQSMGLEGGPAQLQRCQQPVPDASTLARRLLCACQEFHPRVEEYKEGAQRNEALAAVEHTIEAMGDFLSSADKSIDAFCAVLAECKVARQFGTKDLKAICKDHQAEHHQIIRLAVMARSSYLLDQLIGLADRVQLLFQQQKLERGVLDNNDLLVHASRALQDPTIAQEYVQKFRLVMVDEFQDTDQLQLSIVRKLSGPGMCYLCTVGDAQQSIYGFRGADIQVYRAYQKELDSLQLADQGGQPKKLLLSKNFRSHRDVLAFVKAVCQQPCVFGDGFLDLEPSYDGAGYRASEPRIQVCVSAAQSGGKQEDVCAEQAVQIASYFARMKDQGHSLSDMVLLLGATKQAGLYAQAIRDQVGPCVIAGGSLFAAAPEVAVVKSLLCALVNPHDSLGLLNALSSEAFALDASDFLRMTRAYDSEAGCLRECSLDKGLSYLMACVRNGDCSGLSPQLLHALQVMQKTQHAIRVKPVHAVLLDALQDSGWLLRLQRQGAEGLSKAGNILKAVRLVRSIEQDKAYGPATTMHLFAQELEVMKEAPGALNIGGQEAVRIMTIHASKGLEFPIVALADFDQGYRDSALVSRRVDGVPYVSLKAAGDWSVSASFKSELADLGSGSIQMLSPDDFHVRLVSLDKDAAREELQRLFYVGATRAKEALCVFFAVKPSKKMGLMFEDNLAQDVSMALFGGAFSEESCAVDFGGTQPLDYRIVYATGSVHDVQSQEEDRADFFAALGEAGEPASEPVAALGVQPFEWMNAQLPDRQSTGLYSYSSYSKMLKGEKVPQPVVEPQAFDPDIDAPYVEAQVKGPSADADKATDFGSALHRLCQIAALQGFDVARGRIDALCATYGVRDRDRLSRALENWLASDECARAFAFDQVRPELPFNINMGSLVMEGEIDLLCTNKGDLSRAFVVDYKTGGHPDETLEQLEEKHGLQAKCYAYAILCQGYQEVELVFYRVEQGNSVSFTFDVQDREWLRQQACPDSL